MFTAHSLQIIRTENSPLSMYKAHETYTDMLKLNNPMKMYMKWLIFQLASQTVNKQSNYIKYKNAQDYLIYVHNISQSRD